MKLMVHEDFMCEHEDVDGQLQSVLTSLEENFAEYEISLHQVIIHTAHMQEDEPMVYESIWELT